MGIANSFKKLIWTVLMLLLAVIMMYPLVFSVLGGFVKKEAFTSLGNLLPIPTADTFTMANYKYFISNFGIRQFINTILRSAWWTVVVCIMAVFVGYALSRIKFPGRRFFFGFIVFSQVLPGALLFVPTFLLNAKFPFVGGNNWLGMGGHGFINNPAVLYFMVTPVNILQIFLFKQAMDTFPIDYEEAASIDGMNFIGTIFRIVIPMQKPILAVVALNSALWAWNDYINPFIYINDDKYTTITAYVGKLVSYLQTHSDNNYPIIFAISTLATIPILIIFLSLQKYIVEGLSSVGIKG